MTESFYSDLPTEILIQIFSHLNFYDIQCVKVVCANWYAVASRPEFATKGVFKITSCYLKNDYPAAELLFDRRIENLYLKSVQFGEVDKLFKHVGVTLKSLTLKAVPVAEALRLTFAYFQNLQSLRVCQIRVHLLTENMEQLPCGVFKNLKELELTSNSTVVNKYLLACCMDTNALEKIRLHFNESDQHDVLGALEKHSGSLQRVHLEYRQSARLDSRQWVAVFKKLNVKELIVQGNFPFDGIISAVDNKMTLSVVDLSGTIHASDVLMMLMGEQRLPLRKLAISCCGLVTDMGISYLAMLPKLKSINISCCKDVTAESVRLMLGRTPNVTLVEVYLAELNLDEATVCYCANSLPNLQILDLSGCSRAVTNVALQEVFDCLRRLRILRLDNCNDFTDEGMLGLDTGSSIQCLQNLERLSLKGCWQLTDDSMVCGLKLPKLKYLDISYCSEMTNNAAKSLVENCPRLEGICITRTKQMNEEAVRVLTFGLGRLRELKVNNCSNEQQLGSTAWRPAKFRTFTNEITLRRFAKPW